eukprot:TRINITY_DN4380_c0_g1_i9.p2 TRINITY_DN4380_c0_g1~~TRINITY_DN4380_c0_g1_i9.p2  ORF type:complete len:240 (+),score=67.73 TRINITY_DN4380_c0_g1_i9:321-1040(+)
MNPTLIKWLKKQLESKEEENARLKKQLELKEEENESYRDQVGTSYAAQVEGFQKLLASKNEDIEYYISEVECLEKKLASNNNELAGHADQDISTDRCESCQTRFSKEKVLHDLEEREQITVENVFQTRAMNWQELSWDFSIFPEEFVEPEDEPNEALLQAWQAAYDEKCDRLERLESAHIELLADSKEEAQLYHALPSDAQAILFGSQTSLQNVFQSTEHLEDFEEEEDEQLLEFGLYR